MKYKVVFKRSAAKALKKVPKKDQIKIAKKIDNITEETPSPEITKLKGNNPFHRVRVGDYRIIYEIQNYNTTINSTISVNLNSAICSQKSPQTT